MLIMETKASNTENDCSVALAQRERERGRERERVHHTRRCSSFCLQNDELLHIVFPVS